MFAVLKSVLLASRPFYWVNTAFPFMVGWIITGEPVNWIFWLGTLYFLIPYNAAMYGINDIFDYESDLKNPRKASIEGALLHSSQFRPLWIAILILTVPASLILFAHGSVVSKIILFFSLFMVVAYSAPPFRFKEIAFLDSFTSSCHFVTPLLYGVLVAGGSIRAISSAVIAYFLWGMASHAFGAVQDVVYDRQAHIGSVATIIGSRATVVTSTVLYITAAALILFAYPTVLGAGMAFACALYAVNTGRFWQITDSSSPSTNEGWRLFLGFNAGAGAFLTGAWLVSLGKIPLWMPFLISCVTYLFFFRLLRKK